MKQTMVTKAVTHEEAANTTDKIEPSSTCYRWVSKAAGDDIWCAQPSLNGNGWEAYDLHTAVTVRDELRLRFPDREIEALEVHEVSRVIK